MGYKLAGFDVIGCNEIDERVNKNYIRNHNPKYNFMCDIRKMVDMAKKRELPEELYNLDILDGSPPCSTFSMSGNREADWGKEKKFREGQQKQVLDTLFFDFIALANELRPKVVIAENVKGILLGNALEYTKRIHSELEDAGYYCSHFLLNAASMGVPQRRERCFFVAIRKDLGIVLEKQEASIFDDSCPKLDLSFDEEPILFGEIADYKGKPIREGTKTRLLWDNIQKDDTSLADVHLRMFGKNGFFNCTLYDDDKVAPTVVGGGHGCLIVKSKPVYLSTTENILCGSFPLDYETDSEQELTYLIGMSVPPVMMAQVASRVYEQWLSKI